MSVEAPERIGLISNRNSGHNRDRLDSITASVSNCNNIRHLTTDCVDDIPSALEDLAKWGIDTLAINGGDGTASAILGHMLESGIFNQPPRVLLLPGGTANMNAGDIGVRGKLTTATNRFCEWARGDYPAHRIEQRHRVLLRVEVTPDSKPVFGMFLGGGAVIHGTDYAHREIHSRGLRDDFSVALGTMRTLWGLIRNDPEFAQPETIGLQLDAYPDKSDHETMILAVSSLQRLVFGMQPFWGTGPGPLRLTLIEQGSRRFVRTFLSIARGRANKDAIPQNGYISYNTRQISLHMRGGLNLDGEILQPNPDAGPVTITATAPICFLRL